MRNGVTVGFPAKGAPVVLTGPEVPFAEQLTRFRELAGTGKLPEGAPKCEVVEVWSSSGGRVRRCRLGKGGRGGGINPAAVLPVSEQAPPKKRLAKK
jgi:hypothetical protein